MYITYDQWMERTRLGLNKPRSDTLKILDQALKNYDAARTRRNLRDLCHAFEVWKGGKPDWKHSERNTKGAVTDLNDMLTMTGDAALTPLEFILQEQERRVDTLFRGRRMATKRHIVDSVVHVNDVSTNLINVVKGASILGAKVNLAFAQTAQSVLTSFFGHMDLSWEVEVTEEISHYLGAQFMPEFVKSLIPYAGVLTAGANAMWQFGNLAKSAYRHHRVEECRSAVRAGEPRAAIGAIERILVQDMRSRAVKGGAAAFEAVARGCAYALPPLGPAAETVVAGIAGVGKLMYTVYEIGSDFKEKRDANKVLCGGEPVTYCVFDKYPLLGCYYLVCVDTSDVVNFMLKDMGTRRDWMSEVQVLNTRMQPAIAIARRLINDSRFELPHMPKLKMAVHMSEADRKRVHARVAAQGHLSSAHDEGAELAGAGQRFHS